MIEFVFDTNTLIAHAAGKSGNLVSRMKSTRPGTIGLCTIVAHELFYGAFKSQRVEQNLQRLRLMFADLVTIDFDREDALTAGEVRAQLARKGTPIGPLDVLIAGQAKRRGLVMVTNNLREFRRVEGLRCEDWTVAPRV